MTARVAETAAILRAGRLRRNWNQRALAEHLGWRPKYLSDLELGHRVPGVAAARQLAETLHLDRDQTNQVLGLAAEVAGEPHISDRRPPALPGLGDPVLAMVGDAGRLTGTQATQAGLTAEVDALVAAALVEWRPARQRDGRLVRAGRHVLTEAGRCRLEATRSTAS